MDCFEWSAQRVELGWSIDRENSTIEQSLFSALLAFCHDLMLILKWPVINGAKMDSKKEYFRQLLMQPFRILKAAWIFQRSLDFIRKKLKNPSRYDDIYTDRVGFAGFTLSITFSTLSTSTVVHRVTYMLCRVDSASPKYFLSTPQMKQSLVM